MAKTQILQFSINLPDKDLVDALNAELDAGGGTLVNPHGPVLRFPGFPPFFGSPGQPGVPNGLGVAPYNSVGPAGAAVTANALMGLSGAAPVITTGGVMSSPSVSSQWFTGGANFPLNVATFTRKAGGWFGVPLLFGTTTHFYWSGRFAYVPVGSELADPTATTTVARIPNRYFLMSPFLPNFVNNGNTQALNTTPQGKGPTGQQHLFWDEVQTMGVNFQHTAGAGPTNQWDRFYLTVQAMPSAVPQAIWAMTGWPSSGNGFGININSAGQLGFYISDLSALSLQATSAPLEVGRRYRFDVLSNYATSTAGGGRFRVYLNGALIYDSGVIMIGPGAPGTVGGLKVAAVDVGNVFSSPFVLGAISDDRYRASMDYWHAAPIPNISGAETLNSLDWKTGSRLLLLKNTAQGTGFASWTATRWKSLTNRPNVARIPTRLSSSTASAIASYVTDAVDAIKNVPEALGVGAMMIVSLSGRGTTSGSLGFNINAAGVSFVAMTQAATTGGWNFLLYVGPNTIAPLTLTALEIAHRKGNAANAATVSYLQAHLELIGIFDECDGVPLADPETDATNHLNSSVHNSQFPDTPWAGVPDNLAPTFSPFHVVSGTYVGNGTEQDITLKAPPMFVAIRRVTGTGDLGGWFWTSMMGAHLGIEEGINSEFQVLRNRAFAPPGSEDGQELQFLLRVSSTNAMVNTNAVTYHYFAICDPGARFFLGHAIHAGGDTAAAIDENLPVPTFTPTWAFLQLSEFVSNTVTAALYVKGLGSAAASIMPVISTAPLATALTFGAGKVTRDDNLFPSLNGHAALLLGRLNDGTSPAVPPYAQVTYVGDGSASRTVAVALGGKRPLWALVNSGAGGHMRDPSHTSTNSTNISTGNQDATGFTAGGIDSLSVGSSVNASGELYEMFVMPGSTTAGNNGWSVGGEFWPIEPDYPGADLGDPDITEGGDGDGEGEGEIPPEQPDLDDETALPGTALFCLDFTNRLLNQALQKIGVNKRITDAARDETIEASTARDFVKQAVEEVLRAHPWDFATDYELYDAPESGTVDDPTNRDWTYGYQLPFRLITARRLVPQEPGIGRKHTPTPHPFRLGLNETTGHKLFTDAEATEDVPLSLEYTKRVGCPTYFGDPLFKEALVWKFAAFFAASLSRDPAKARWCESMFMGVLDRAETVDANEQQTESGTTQNADPDWLRDRS